MTNFHAKSTPRTRTTIEKEIISQTILMGAFFGFSCFVFAIVFFCSFFCNGFFFVCLLLHCLCSAKWGVQQRVDETITKKKQTISKHVIQVLFLFCVVFVFVFVFWMKSKQQKHICTQQNSSTNENKRLNNPTDHFGSPQRVSNPRRICSFTNREG